MGYKSKKEYRKAAHKFLSDNQSNEAAVITDGIWTGKGTNNGRLQRAIQVDNKTAIFDVESGDIIDFYDGTGLGQKFKVVETY